MTIPQKTIVLYHKNCTDGFGAAFVAWKKFGDTAIYIPVSDRKTPPDEVLLCNDISNTSIYVIDFCYPKEVLQDLTGRFKQVVVLDHHLSAHDDIKGAGVYMYGEDKSGAYLAWEYFFPDVSVPVLIQYISDGDTWAHKLPSCREVQLYIYNQDYTFDTYEKLMKHCEDSLENIISIGVELLKAHNYRLKVIEETAELVELEGFKVYAVNATFDIKSDIGHILAEKTNSFALVFSYDEGRYKCSLRSVEDFDVSKIAEKYGGGGHKNAAAFIVDTEFPIPFVKRVI